MKSLFLGDMDALNARQPEEYAQDGVPVDRRRAAKRLYEIGEKDLGLNYLIKEMNRYKNR